MSAIFKIDVRGDYNLICGGNLVSNKHVLTGEILWMKNKLMQIFSLK